MLPFVLWGKTIYSDLSFDIYSFRACWTRPCVVDRTLTLQWIFISSANKYSFIGWGIIVVISWIPMKNIVALSTELWGISLSVAIHCEYWSLTWISIFFSNFAVTNRRYPLIPTDLRIRMILALRVISKAFLTSSFSAAICSLVDEWVTYIGFDVYVMVSSRSMLAVTALKWREEVDFYMIPYVSYDEYVF